MSDERFHVIWVTGGELGILMNESVDWELELSPSWRSWFRRLVLRYPKDPDEEWKRGVVLFRLVLEEWNSLLPLFRRLPQQSETDAFFRKAERLQEKLWRYQHQVSVDLERIPLEIYFEFGHGGLHALRAELSELKHCFEKLDKYLAEQYLEQILK